jgi:flagellar biosynthesis protein FlhA
MFKSFLSSNRDLTLVLFVVGILLVLFTPIPPVLLDLLLISNFGLALTILLLTFYVEKPVNFSTFPSILLVATLYRLALNVAATRLILTDANAGEVIGAIGAFAVQGNFVIGLVVFFILVIVQYIVVTSGAQRVSEVSARFVLDSMPGQQMSIDADLNMGLIDQNEAKRRRRELEKEASFYGSMDGASKFVKGDAIAGVIILLINIIAGWIIGVAQLGMDWLTALQTFTLLTIGDGIVTQAPALIVAVATGIIVTRSSADRQLGSEVISQLTSVPRILLIVVGALMVLLILPGMPKWPIGLVALAALGAFFAQRRRERQVQLESPIEVADESDAREVGRAAPAVEVQLGKDLADHWRPLGPVLTDRVNALRGEHEKASGFVFPPVVFQDGSKLSANAYEILLHGARHAQAMLYPDRTLAIRVSQSAVPLEGIETRDPAFRLPGVWITDDQRDTALQGGYTLVDPLTVLVTHLGELLRSEAPLLLSRAEVVSMLEGVRGRQPGLIEDLIPATLTVSDVQRVMQALLSENVSIRNVDQIAEALVDAGRSTKDISELTEMVRQRLSHGICHTLRLGHEHLSVLSLNPKLEAQFADAIKNGAAGPNGFVIEPKLAEQFIRKLIPMTEAMMQQSLAPVLLCGPEIRRHLKTFTRRSVPRLAVVSVNEVPPSVDLASFGVITVD